MEAMVGRLHDHRVAGEREAASLPPRPRRASADRDDEGFDEVAELRRRVEEAEERSLLGEEEVASLRARLRSEGDFRELESEVEDLRAKLSLQAARAVNL